MQACTKSFLFVTGWIWSRDWVLSKLVGFSAILLFTSHCETTWNSDWIYKRRYEKTIWWVHFLCPYGSINVSFLALLELGWPRPFARTRSDSDTSYNKIQEKPLLLQRLSDVGKWTNSSHIYMCFWLDLLNKSFGPMMGCAFYTTRVCAPRYPLGGQ